MTLQDAIFNWLQIKIVSEGRPNDKSAKETLDFFATILREDHHLDHLHVEIANHSTYIVHYVKEGESKTQKYMKEFADKLLQDIESNPKYNE